MRVRETGRTDPLIVEAAEAVGCSTDLVASVAHGLPGLPGLVAVTFTPDYPEGEEVYAANLRRGRDGILHEIRRVKIADSIGDLLAEGMDS